MLYDSQGLHWEQCQKHFNVKYQRRKRCFAESLLYYSLSLYFISLFLLCIYIPDCTVLCCAAAKMLVSDCCCVLHTLVCCLMPSPPGSVCPRIGQVQGLRILRNRSGTGVSYPRSSSVCVVLIVASPSLSFFSHVPTLFSSLLLSSPLFSSPLLSSLLLYSLLFSSPLLSSPLFSSPLFSCKYSPLLSSPLLSSPPLIFSHLLSSPHSEHSGAPCSVHKPCTACACGTVSCLDAI